MGSGEVTDEDFRNAHNPSAQAQGAWRGRWRGQQQQHHYQQLEKVLAFWRLALQGRSLFRRSPPLRFGA